MFVVLWVELTLKKCHDFGKSTPFHKVLLRMMKLDLHIKSDWKIMVSLRFGV